MNTLRKQRILTKLAATETQIKPLEQAKPPKPLKQAEPPPMPEAQKAPTMKPIEPATEVEVKAPKAKVGGSVNAPRAYKIGNRVIASPPKLRAKLDSAVENPR